MMRNTFFTLFLINLIFSIFPALANAQEIRKHDTFVVHSIPKCGTHFIQHTLTKLTGKGFNHSGEVNFEKHLAHAEQSNKLLRLFGPDHDTGREILQRKRYKFVSMIRDPRDALISLLFYMRRNHWAGSLTRDFFIVDTDFDSLSLDNQIFSLIQPKKGGKSYISYYKHRSGWSLMDYGLVIKYEDLVGESGGGTSEKQIDTILDLISYTNIQINGDELHQAISELYIQKGTPIKVENKTFYPSSIGNWKTFLNEDHKKFIKLHWGEMLIQLGYEKDLNW